MREIASERLIATGPREVESVDESVEVGDHVIDVGVLAHWRPAGCGGAATSGGWAFRVFCSIRFKSSRITSSVAP